MRLQNKVALITGDGRGIGRAIALAYAREWAQLALVARSGFVCERVPHIMLGAIANNAEIDVVWETAQGNLEPLREELNRSLGTSWKEWEIPRDADESWPEENRDAPHSLVGVAHRPPERN